jgi:ADP-Ribosyltransferase in polyvalent proteins/Peptidase M15
MDDDKAIRAAKLTLGGMLEKRRAKTAVERAQGQIAPSKYLPNVPRQVHADGGRVYPLADRSEWYGDANYQQTGGQIVHMSPDEYLSKVRPLDIDEASRDNIDDLKNHIMSGRTLDPLKIDAGGREDGRHRAHAAKELGIKQVPVLTWPRQVRANGGYVPAASLPIPKLAVARGTGMMAQPTAAETLAALASFGKMATGLYDTFTDEDRGKPQGGDPQPQQQPQDGHAARVEAGNGMSQTAVDAWGRLVDAYGQPLTVTSSYRDPAHNERVGGAKDSQHTHGNAYDIDVSGMSHEDRLALADMAWNAGFRGFGFYDNSMHFDVGGSRAWGPSYSRDSIPSWAQDWTSQRYGYASGGSVMTPEEIEEQMLLQGQPNGENAAQSALDYVDKAGRIGGIAGRATGVPLGGTLGRKAAEYAAMSKFADGGSVSDPRSAFLEGNHPLVPEVLYHGTARDIRSFDPNAKRSYDIDPSNPDETDTGWFGKGHYFTASPKMADHYADEGARRSGGEGANVMPVHVSMKNPFVVDMKEYDSGAMTLDKALTAKGVPLHSRGWRKPSEQTAALIAMGHDGVIATREGKPKEYVAFHPHQIKSALSATTFDPTATDITKADGGPVDGYAPQRTVRAYKLFRRNGGQLFPLFVHANKPVPMGQWLEAEEGPRGKAQGKVKSKLGDLAYRPGWHAGDLPIATHIGGKSSPNLKKPDYRPDDHVWAEIEMAADKDWQSVADSRGKGVKAHITDQVPLGGFYRYKTNPNMTGNWLIGGHMKVNRVLSDDEVKSINDAAGTADLPRRQAFASGGAANAPMFEGIHEDLQDEQGNPLELWHGTPEPQEFEAFDDAKVGSERDAGFYGRGHYLTPDYDTAEEYASHSETGEVGNVMGPLHAALKNPFVWDMSDESKAYRTKKDLETMGIKREGRLNPWDNLMSHEIDTFMKHMNQRGHDGVIVKQPNWQDGEGSRVTEIVVFKPTAIKHKDAEVFDPTDPRIRRNDGGRVNLYSKAARIVSAMKDQKMDVQDILKYALGKGVKKTELAHVDVPSGKATPKQVADHIEFMQPQIGVRRLSSHDFRFGDSQAYLDELNRLQDAGRHDEADRLYSEFERFEGYSGEGEPKYARYQLPDGQNYREHILTLDSHPSNDPYYAKIHWGRLKNPLAHIRMSDRALPDGRKILHIEEVQSDWNNDARKHGFRTGTEWEDYQKYVDKMRDEAVAGIDPTASPSIRDAMRAKYNTMDPYMLALKMGRQTEHNELARKASNPEGVPQAPYINPDRDDASEVAMKHILMEAAKGGYDGIAFTPDKAQEERWPGHTFKGIYDKKLPGMAERLVKTHDPDYGLDDMMNIGGWGAPMIPLSPEARDSINKNGFSSFRRGGYVTHVRRAR